MAQHTRHSRSETGAVLVHAALVLIGLMAMSTFIVDYGVLWAARRQAQNAADAGALAGAVHFLYDTSETPTADVLSTARAVAVANTVWEAVPVVTSAFECPTYVTYVMPDCVRVDVYRDTDHANPLPMLFGAFLGRDRQNIRATATARASQANASDCVKPFAVPDYYLDIATYSAPGYQLDLHLGTPITLREGPPTALPDWYRPIDFAGGGGPVTEWVRAVVTCFSGTRALGDTLAKRSLPVGKSAADAVNMVLALDPAATYDVLANRVINSCAQTRSCMKWVTTDGSSYTQVPDPGRTISPRVFIIPVLNPKSYSEGSSTIPVENLVGVFVTAQNIAAPYETTGILVKQPGLIKSGAGTAPSEAAFLRAITLIR